MIDFQLGVATIVMLIILLLLCGSRGGLLFCLYTTGSY